MIAPIGTKLTARHEGWCHRCETAIAPGQRIEMVLGGWVHEECPEETGSAEAAVDGLWLEDDHG